MPAVCLLQVSQQQQKKIKYLSLLIFFVTLIFGNLIKLCLTLDLTLLQFWIYEEQQVGQPVNLVRWEASKPSGWDARTTRRVAMLWGARMWPRLSGSRKKTSRGQGNDLSLLGLPSACWRHPRRGIETGIVMAVELWINIKRLISAG